MLSGYTRQKFGFVATFENERGETISAHRTGKVGETLPKLLDEVLDDRP